jgi:hypothetical protein
MRETKMDELEKRIEKCKDKGKTAEKITWGMLNDGFTSLSGVPDEFYSAEDPADRQKLWAIYGEQYSSEPGRCRRCGSRYCVGACD